MVCFQVHTMKISFITPIYNRPEYLLNVITTFQEQTYLNKELIIVDDSDELWPEWVIQILPDNIKYMTCDKLPVGAKRNIACQAATGDLIVHLDSDDTYAHNWGEMCVDIYKQQKTDVIGLRNAYFTKGEETWLYTCPLKQQYVLGATMCYSKSFWERNKFFPEKCGEDATFQWRPNVAIYEHDYIEGFVATIHDGNTSPRLLTDSAWSKVDIPLPIHPKHHVHCKDM